VQVVKRSIYIVAICFVLLLVACVGWAVEGVRYGLTGSRRRALATT
jgi:hypothetical protein